MSFRQTYCYFPENILFELYIAYATIMRPLSRSSDERAKFTATFY